MKKANKKQSSGIPTRQRASAAANILRGLDQAQLAYYDQVSVLRAALELLEADRYVPRHS